MTNKPFLALFLIFFNYSAKAQDLNYTLSDDSLVNFHASNKRIYYATRTEFAPKIDGRLNDECWKTTGTWDGNFIQQQPHQAKPPSQQTEVKILYDNNYLYFALVCYDNEPEKMDPILARRDENEGDMAGIALDTYNDKQTAREFNLTSAGQKVDLMHLGEYGWDFNWDAVWDGKTSIGDSAWYAEMRIPFSQLRFADNPEHVWGMHIWRWINRLSEESQWKLIPVDAPAMVYIFGELRGIKDIPFKRNVEIMPYSKAKYFTDVLHKQNVGVGIDGKMSVTSDFNLDYTINPDFGQVEADPSELNLTSYEVFYDEKRPFFLEGNNILEYNSGSDMLFYSRRIGHAPSYLVDETEPGKNVYNPENTSILNALKLTGKNRNGLSLGIINSMTAREFATIYSDDETSKTCVEPFANYTVGRIKKDLNHGNTVFGGIVTAAIRNIKDDHLEFLSDNAWVGGVDFEHNWLNRKYFVSAKNFFSTINGTAESIGVLQQSSRHLYQREDAEHLTYDDALTTLKGWGGELAGGKRSGRFRLMAKLNWRSPGVDMNDLGYLRQADYISEKTDLLYQVNKPSGILLKYLFSITQNHQWSFGGENITDRLTSMAGFTFKNYWSVGLEFDRVFYELDTRQLRGGPALKIDGVSSLQVTLGTDRAKNFFCRTGTNQAFGDDKISGQQLYMFYFKWLINKRFSVSSQTNFIQQANYNQYVFQKRVNHQKEYVVGKINRKTIFTTLRAELFITPELSFQYYGSPYASVGKYEDFRKVAQASSDELALRFSPLFVTNAQKPALVDEGGFQFQDLSEWNPDFNFQEFRSNFVARWEYKTGSVLYFVWTNNRSRYENKYENSVINSFKGIAKVKAQNAFMLKISYWFSL